MFKSPIALLVLAFLSVGGCASPSVPPAEEAAYFRSPSHDYVEPLRSASDGEVVGAQQQPASDTLQVSGTTAHPGAGWEVDSGQLRFNGEATRGGHGVLRTGRSCELDRRGPSRVSPTATERSLPSPSLPVADKGGPETEASAEVLALAVNDPAWPNCRLPR